MKLQALMMAALISGSPLMLDDGCCETQTYYNDIDADGYGSETDTVEACDAPIGYVDEAGDCDDLNPRVNPGAEEVCDGIDNNCNGLIDEEGCRPDDLDGDGYPVPEDCDDENPRVNPGAEEVCDGIDNNCNGQVDEEGCRPDDQDGDGYPVPEDCDDENPRVNPGAEEVCDGIDNNCDGQVDEYCAEMRLCEATGGDWSTGCVPSTCEMPCGDCVQCIVEVELCACPEESPYWDEEFGCISEDMCEVTIDDADGDGYPADRDCNDRDASVHPGAPEVCDAIDNDCDGMVDEDCR